MARDGRMPAVRGGRADLKRQLAQQVAIIHARREHNPGNLLRHWPATRCSTGSALYYISIGSPPVIYSLAAEKQLGRTLALDACRQSARFAEAIASLRIT